MILVFGQTGQVASALQELEPNAVFLGRDQANLENPASCAAAIHQHQPSVVINAAAYTAVDKAESETTAAQLVNAEAPKAMAAACAELEVPFVHISTDYVFDGSGEEPFATDNPTGPLGVYGQTKLDGEDSIRHSNAVYAILRTSWVFSDTGANFVKTMLRLGAERDSLSIVADQVGGPTPARAIAEACLTIAARLQKDPKASGTYHFSGFPDVSWAQFARSIFQTAHIECAVGDIPTEAYPTPAKRPLNSRLDCQKTEEVFGIKRPDWKAELSQILVRMGS